MPTPSHLIGVKGDECQCGRRQTIRHCPACGSSRAYARMNRYHTMLDGSLKLVPTEFRCQSCGHLFIDEERMFCDAPPVGPKLAARKVQALAEAKKSGEYLSDSEEKAAKAIVELVDGAKAQERGESQEEKPQMSDEQLAAMDWDIRRMWSQAKLEGKTKLSAEEFIINLLKEQNAPESFIERVKAYHKFREEDLARQREAK